MVEERGEVGAEERLDELKGLAKSVLGVGGSADDLGDRSAEYQAFLSCHLLGSVRPLLDYLRDDGAMDVEITFVSVLPHEPYDSGVSHAPCTIKAKYQRPRSAQSQSQFIPQEPYTNRLNLSDEDRKQLAEQQKLRNAELDAAKKNGPDLRYWSAR